MLAKNKNETATMKTSNPQPLQQLQEPGHLLLMPGKQFCMWFHKSDAGCSCSYSGTQCNLNARQSTCLDDIEMSAQIQHDSPLLAASCGPLPVDIQLLTMSYTDSTGRAKFSKQHYPCFWIYPKVLSFGKLHFASSYGNGSLMVGNMDLRDC